MDKNLFELLIINSGLNDYFLEPKSVLIISFVIRRIVVPIYVSFQKRRYLLSVSLFTIDGDIVDLLEMYV